MYAVRFWEQVLKKYPRGTQDRRDLCFGGFMSLCHSLEERMEL